ncbi:hypothetical protein ABID37_000868 [Aquamicrobium terrae]|uniref:Uncharacterized protein n=1 Tax=Aquamicrobium terrae TaxID=1324945 RepID=A0ABV2MXQ6_9HYPH
MSPQTRRLFFINCIWGLAVTSAYAFVIFMTVVR